MFLGGFFLNLLCSLVPTCSQQYRYPVLAQSQNFGFQNRLDPITTLNQYVPGAQFPSTLSEFDDELKEVAARVNTTTGLLEGYVMKTIKGVSIYAFEGIRYAEPPIGSHRFQAPISKKPWVGLRDAKSPGPVCLQLSVPKMFRVIGDEDCLFMNIYSPVLSFGGISPDLPVIVYFHGGSYHMGAGSDYGPTYLLDSDVLLVTVNYRLGVLGFMSTGDYYNSGNWGLKDQAMALEWINANIRNFGGDAKRVTLMGQESGGSMAHLHMVSTQTRKYFQSVVSLSGTAMNHWSVNTPEMSRRWTLKLANIIGCRTENSAVIMECMHSQSSFNLVTASLHLHEWFYFPTVTFAPVIEPKSTHAFLTETPEQAYESQRVAPKPFIASRIANEGHSTIFLLRRHNRISELRFNWDRLAPHYLAYDFGVENASQITNSLTRVYFGGPPSQSPLDPLSDVTGDRRVTHGLHKSLQAHYTLAPSYSYVLTYRGVHNLATVNGLKDNEWGAGHLEDVFLYFNASNHIHGMSLNDTDYKISKIMINMLVNFVTKGEPFISDDNGDSIKMWEPVNAASDIKMLQIDGDVKMISEPYINQVRFWEAMGLKDTIPVNTPVIKHNFIRVRVH